jgi:hypothetical protein
MRVLAFLGIVRSNGRALDGPKLVIIRMVLLLGSLAVDASSRGCDSDYQEDDLLMDSLSTSREVLE